MKEEIKFSQTLESLMELARQQGNTVGKKQAEEAFRNADILLGEKQYDMICDYLKAKNIGIGEPADPFDYMTQEETDYLEAYLKELEALPAVTEGEREAITLSAMAQDADARDRLTEIFLPEVVEIAKLYAGQGVFLEDLIGEGNVALSMAVRMLDCEENAQQAQGTIAGTIMEAMETYIAENVQEKSCGEKMAQKANDVLERAQEMARELGRRVTVEELSEETGMAADKIAEAVRITADNIDYLDTKEMHG